jgi:ubiquinone/menaquinone biosynthesis C-methylase UbiE
MVTGIDFSERAIETARELVEETGLDARFVQSDIYDLSDVLDEQFDIVFISSGVIYWLPDLDEWASRRFNSSIRWSKTATVTGRFPI